MAKKKTLDTSRVSRVLLVGTAIGAAPFLLALWARALHLLMRHLWGPFVPSYPGEPDGMMFAAWMFALATGIVLGGALLWIAVEDRL